jgi:hypothetical protein
MHRSLFDLIAKAIDALGYVFFYGACLYVIVNAIYYTFFF